MNVNQERIARLQQEMQKEGMDLYLVPTADFHQSEYVGDYFKARAWLSGFTGSAGTLVVTKKRSMPLGRWKIFHSGCETVGRNRCYPDENGRRGSSCN